MMELRDDSVVKSGEMAFLFMQRTRIQSSALMSGNSQSPVIPAPRDPTMHANVYVHTCAHIHT